MSENLRGNVQNLFDMFYGLICSDSALSIRDSCAVAYLMANLYVFFGDV